MAWLPALRPPRACTPSCTACAHVRAAHDTHSQDLLHVGAPGQTCGDGPHALVPDLNGTEVLVPLEADLRQPGIVGIQARAVVLHSLGPRARVLVLLSLGQLPAPSGSHLFNGAQRIMSR
eukprot:m.76767 g.76767  ORF g.76767 m.76767 type:complete len:120 (+) comp7891_c0_seq4:725-1084(+)